MIELMGGQIFYAETTEIFKPEPFSRSPSKLLIDGIPLLITELASPIIHLSRLIRKCLMVSVWVKMAAFHARVNFLDIKGKLLVTVPSNGRAASN